MADLLGASSMVVLGTVESLGDPVVFARNPDGSPYMVGTLTTVNISSILFGEKYARGADAAVFLQNGGTAEGVTVSFDGEPLRLPGDLVLAFGVASQNSASEVIPSFWVNAFASVDEYGKLEPSVVQQIAPFLAGMSVAEIADEIAGLSDKVEPLTPRMTFPPNTKDIQATGSLAASSAD